MCYSQLQRSLPAHRVMWANMRSENLYLVNYPQAGWVDNEVPVQPDFDPAPTPTIPQAVGADFDLDWMRSKQYREDARGDLVGKDTRHRVFEENEPVKGTF